MPRYLVSGAAGLIGSNLVAALCERGAQVVTVDSLVAGARGNLAGLPVEFIEADITEHPILAGPWDAVFHHGDITDPRHPDPAVVLAHNRKAFTQMVRTAQEGGGRLIYASSAGVYGNGPSPMCEDQPKDLQTAYAQSKYAMDEQAAELAARMEIVGLRYFNVFGHGEAHKGRAASMIFHLFNQIAQGHAPRLFEFGEQKRDFIYVKDTVEACLKALTAPSGVYNVGTGRAVSFNELVQVISAVLGIETRPEYFAMPYDAATYQACTQADTAHTQRTLGFTAQWTLEAAVQDYWRKLLGEIRA